MIQLWTPGYGGDSDRMILFSFRNGQLPLKINDLRSLCQCKSLSDNMLEGFNCYIGSNIVQHAHHTKKSSSQDFTTFRLVASKHQ